MFYLRAAAAATLVAAGALSACTSADSPPAPPPSSTSSSSGPPVLSAALPHTAADLAAQMQHGLAVATSAQVLVTPAGGVAAHGDLTLAGGTPTALDLTTRVAGGPVRVLVVNSVAYARFGPASAGPWSPVPATGRVRAAVRAVRSLLVRLRPLASPAGVLALVRSGTATLLGRGSIGGIPAAHYRVRAAGTPVDLWVDGGSRPLRVRISGRGAVAFSGYGAPVHIVAPAPAQISG